MLDELLKKIEARGRALKMVAVPPLTTIPSPLDLLPDAGVAVTGDDLPTVFRRELAARESEVMRALSRTWLRQRRVVEDVGGRLLDVPVAWQSAWLDEYTQFVNDQLVPAWGEMFRSGSDYYGERLEAIRRGYIYEPLRVSTRLEAWASERAGNLIRQLTNEQRKAVRALLYRYVATDQLAPRSLAQLIRPVVGLTEFYGRAVDNHRRSLLEAGLTPAQAEQRAGVYAARLQRIRSETIARTELATAFNAGSHETVRSAQTYGDIDGQLVSVWLTAEDERVCEICAPLHDQVIEFDEQFVATEGVSTPRPIGQHPPAHPRCRCTTVYRIIGGLSDEVEAEASPEAGVRGRRG